MGLLQNRSILVADDEPSVRNLLTHFLTDLGAKVTLAENGHVAFRKATQEGFDLICMDIAMPNWSGLDAVRSLALVMPKTRILVISGYLDDRMRQDLEKEGNVIEAIRKPVELDYLQSVILHAFSELI